MRIVIEGGTIVNEGRTFDGTIIIEDGNIVDIVKGQRTKVKGSLSPSTFDDALINASGCYILPGIIDDHVHFREPGMTEKADMAPRHH